jgi:hypothetical protein
MTVIRVHSLRALIVTMNDAIVSTVDNYRERPGKIAAAMAFLAMAFLVGRALLFPEPPVPIGVANGQYFNDRCGMMTFKNGIIQWGNSQARYILEKDKFGLLALTDYFVGVQFRGADCRILSDHAQFALYLRFDDETNPRAVTVSQNSPPATVEFVRKPDQ